MNIRGSGSRKKGGIEDVYEELRIAKDKYNKHKPQQSRIGKWLVAFLARLLLYGQVFDMVSSIPKKYSHNGSDKWLHETGPAPPRICLPCMGFVKFLFIAVLNHEELISCVGKALLAIADALPLAKLKLELYGTDTILQAVAQLYAQIMGFSQRAIKWYTDGRVKHVMHSIILLRG